MIELVTGASGLVGSHLVERLVRSGRRVRALVRHGSPLEHLRELGVELAFGDLRDRASLEAALEGVSVVYHNAALVGDWGPRAEFVEVGVRGTERLAALAERRGVERFVHMSSATVYGLLRMLGRHVSEDARLSWSFWDPYARAKIAAERALWRRERAGRLRLSVLRPSFVYGPRDRLIVPRTLRLLREGELRVIGSGRNRPHLVHAADVAEAAVRAGERAQALGRAYNLDGPRDASQREILDVLVAEGAGPRPTGSRRTTLAYLAAAAAEVQARLARRTQPPPITRYVVACLAGETDLDTERARRELGWEPRVPTLEGMRLACRAEGALTAAPEHAN
jgi:nucleoside-diphosphate-sugar epimerase